MTLQQLRYFCVMAKVLHYTKAAESLYVSQPSLSYALSELEKELNVALFEKQGKHTLLTKYGEVFLPYAQNALNEISKGTVALEQMLKPTINLGYITSISVEFIPQIMNAFFAQQKKQNISFNFVSGKNAGMVQQLKNNELDLIFTTDVVDNELGSIPLFTQELFLVVPNGHPLSHQSEVCFDDFKNGEFVTLNPYSSYRAQLMDYFHSKGGEPKIIFAVDEWKEVSTLVSSRMGIAIMPMVPTISDANVSVLHIKDPPTRIVYFLWNKHRQMSDAVKCFYDFVIANYGKDMGEKDPREVKQKN